MDEEKKAFGLNTALNAMTAVDGVKQMGKSYKDVNNKYDNILNTNVDKSAKSMGASNSLISRSASEEIDEIFKEAGIKSGASKIMGSVSKGVKNVGKKIIELDENNAKNISDTVKNFKSGKKLEGFKSLGKSTLYTAPAIGAAGAAGYGAAKGLKKIDDKFGNDRNRKEQKNVEFNALGTALTATLIASGLANKGAVKPVGKAFSSAKESLIKYPINKMKNKTPAVKEAFKQVKKVDKVFKTEAAKTTRNIQSEITGHAKRMFRDFDEGSKTVAEIKENYLKVLKKDFRKNKAAEGLSDIEIDDLWDKVSAKSEESIDKAIDILSNRSKKASTEIDLIEKLAGQKTNYAKKVFKENF